MTSLPPTAPPHLPDTRGRARSILAVAAAVGLAAYNSGNNVFYLVASALAAMVLLAKVRGTLALRPLTLRGYAGAHGLFARRQCHLDVVVESREAIGVALAHPALDAAAEAVAGPAGGAVRVSITPPRRGWESLSDLVATSRGPYGITQHRRRVGLRAPILVFPEPAPDFDLTAHLGPRHRSAETAMAAAPGEGTDFLMLRDYRPEDGVRRVYWKGVARTGQLLSRVHERPREYAITFVLSPFIPEDTPAWRARFEAALSRLTAAVLQAEERALPYGLRTPGLALPPALGTRHRLRVLGELALAQPEVGPGRAPAAARRSDVLFDATVPDHA